MTMRITITNGDSDTTLVTLSDSMRNSDVISQLDMLKDSISILTSLYQNILDTDMNFNGSELQSDLKRHYTLYSLED